jgi:MYXO-CTERM domain-containing protein
MACPLLSMVRSRVTVVAAMLVFAVPACGPGEDFHAGEAVGSTTAPVHTVCGSGNTVEGIDVSKWQGAIDWSGVKQAGVVFAIVRASHGTGTIDEYFDANWKGTKANGIIRGVYQYFEPGQDPVAQAKVLVDMVQASGGFEHGDLPAVIDVETTGGQSASVIMANIHAWIDYVESATQRRPIIYTGSYFWDDHGLDDSLSSYPLWTAHYTSNPCPLTSSAWAKWTFWQYTDSGSVTGIGGHVDRDVFDGTLDDLQQFIADSEHGTTQPDAGEPDAGEPDAGEPDAAVTADAQEPDAAVVAPDAADDSVPQMDAASQEDGAGEPDAAMGPDAADQERYEASMADESPCSCSTPGEGRGRSRGAMAWIATLAAVLWRRRSAERMAGASRP